MVVAVVVLLALGIEGRGAGVVAVAAAARGAFGGPRANVSGAGSVGGTRSRAA